VLWRCQDCSHVLRDLSLCDAVARGHAWGGDADLDPLRLALTYRRMRRVLGADPSASGSAFEIGFGSGELLRRFLDDASTVAGVDAMELEVAIDPRVATAGRLFAGEIETLPETAGSYDVVYGVHVLEHLRDPRLALSRCRGLLRPGGQVYFLTPTAASAGPWLFGAAWWLLEDPTHVRFFSPASVRRALHDAGFTDVRVRRVLLDNLSMEACSAVRLLRKERSMHGVLAHPSTRGLAALLALPTVVARLIWPHLRPTLEVTARKP
jgi:2-polyprenyl-3-methyl-5-hydroxy-6-metoxy-1,4-benzoquinol methylase